MAEIARVAVQMDPIERINIAGDSTFALLLEAQARGFEILYYTPDRLSLRGSDVVATAQTLAGARHRRRPFHAGHAARNPLRDMDVVLLRQDPPFDLSYITSTHLLERIGGRNAGRQRSRRACATRRKNCSSWISRS